MIAALRLAAEMAARPRMSGIDSLPPLRAVIASMG